MACVNTHSQNFAKNGNTLYVQKPYIVRTLYGILPYMDKRIELRCTYKEFERYSEAARKSGRNLSAWLRWVANLSSEWPEERLPDVVRTNPETVVRTNPLDGLRVAGDVGQDRVVEVVFERPATWRLLTESGLRHTVTKKVDPSAPKWARQDLSNFCVENDIQGFQKAWGAMESEMLDGGFSQ